MGIADKMKSLIKENAVLILFTGIILPIITFMIEKAFFPEVIDHIVRRLPLNINRWQKKLHEKQRKQRRL